MRIVIFCHSLLSPRGRAGRERDRGLVVLREGRVSETGTHRELMSLNGYYASLVRHQTKGLLPHDEPHVVLMPTEPAPPRRDERAPSPAG